MAKAIGSSKSGKLAELPAFLVLNEALGIPGAIPDGVERGATVLQNGHLNGWND